MICNTQTVHDFLLRKHFFSLEKLKLNNISQIGFDKKKTFKACNIG